MSKIYKYAFLLISMLCLAANAQEVSGTVTDDKSQPLPGVTVVVKGTDVGTTTDFDGNYIIQADQGQTLIFSYIGFQSKEVLVSGSTLNVSLAPGVALAEVVLVGSRRANRVVTESAVPIDVLDIQELANSTPQVNLNQILNYVAPSFSSSTQTISDGTDHIDPASLRGLGPDQVLVLINGKRRHTSSLVNVNGTFGRGNVGTDLNAIPAAAIKRIEVLRDGAAAQYGSDAIAGVINIVLNNNVNELTMSVTAGANMSKYAENQTGGIDGETINVAASYGLPLGENGGYINFSGDFDYRDFYSRMKEWEGGIFNAYNAIEYQASQDPTYDLIGLENSLTDIQNFATQVPHFSSDLQSAISGAASLEELQTILNVDVTEAELKERRQVRSDYNMRVGQSALRGGRIFSNFSLPLNDEGTELYAFAGLSARRGNSAGFYRLPNQARAYTPIYVNGFLPEINSTITDQSLATGIRGKIGEWNVDFSNVYGKNKFLYSITNSSNASLLNSTPTSFDAGGFAFIQNTTNLDLTRFYEDVFAGFNVAFGAEHRFENYEIIAGEAESFERYDVNGRPINGDDQIGTTDFFGTSRPGGSQVFPGFGVDNELSRSRSSVAGYIDVEADFTEELLVSAATRFENYSDFGSTLNFKLATRYKLNDDINVRLAANTGFRAPSLHQLHFNSTSTIFDGEAGIPQEVGTFSNDSRVASLLGIPQLKEEKSRSISLGTTAKIPNLNLSITVDGYFVQIDDRVIYTGQFRGPNSTPPSELDVALSQANAEAASFFANAIDTESKGLDVVITHNTTIFDDFKLKTDLAATLSQTRKVGDINASELLRSEGLESTYFNEESRVYLEEAVPRTKINLSNSLVADKFNVFLRNVYFGEVTEANVNPLRQQVYDGRIVTDLSFGYKFTEDLMVTVGANNLFDIYPERSTRRDLIPGEDGVQNNRSGGRFDWSRRSPQIGLGGRFLFARLNFTLK